MRFGVTKFTGYTDALQPLGQVLVSEKMIGLDLERNW